MNAIIDRFDIGYSLRNWTFGFAWDDDAFTVALGPIGLTYWFFPSV